MFFFEHIFSQGKNLANLKEKLIFKINNFEISKTYQS